MVSLRHSTLVTNLKAQAQTQAPALVATCNEALQSDAHHTNVQVSAAKWAPSGNLVVFAGPDTTLTKLQASHHIITSAIKAVLPERSPLVSHPNIKWSKLLINSVPTGVTDISPAHSCEECHQALLRDNPSYRRLRVTQLPSWVKKPSDYKPHSSSSLVVSFEDPDGSTLSSLVAARHLFGFGAQLTIHKWKNPLPSPAKIQVCRVRRGFAKLQVLAPPVTVARLGIGSVISDSSTSTRCPHTYGHSPPPPSDPPPPAPGPQTPALPPARNLRSKKKAQPPS